MTALYPRARIENWLILAIVFMFCGIPISRAENKPLAAIPAASSPPAPAPQPASPLATAIQSLLKEGVHPKLRWGQFPDYQAQLEALYQTSGYSPLWTKDGKAIPQAQKVIANLASADAKGLDSADYDAELLKRWLGEINRTASDNPQELASFDVALSLSLMRYASNLYMGRVNPRRVHFGLDIEPKKEDLPDLLHKLASGNSPDQLLAELEPRLKLYEYLKNALTHYQQLAKDMPTAPAINLPVKFKPGASHPDVPALRKLLFTLGDLTAGDPNDPTPLYDQDLAEAVERFQSRHGLTEDGIIGKSTLNQLLVPLSDRIKQIQLGLERLRWLPDHIDGRYLMVNIPSFQLYGFHNGSSAERADLEMNVIVGEAINGRNTPVFHSDMTYVNFRPYWNVPYSIAVKEYLPIASRNPGYLSSHNLEIVSNSAPHSGAYAASYENIQQLATGALKLRQRPGPKNALGLVKFAFPNTNNVYLHSTPSQGLFKRSRRDFSHGCIRVEYPVKLAEFVLKDHEEWTRERIENAMKREAPRTVTLKTPIPVYIFYSTVLADENGRVMFFHDIYGHDRILIEQLGKGFPYPS